MGTPGPMRRWYAVHTRPHEEDRARWHLTNQGYDVYLPSYLKERRHARRKQMVRAPLFPRYLFVGMDLNEVRWRAIASTVGVIDIVRSGDIPVPLPKGIIEEIRAREDDSGLIRRDTIETLSPGDPVRICEGALVDQLAAIHSLGDSERVTLLLEILGRPVKVRVPRQSVVATG